MRLRRIVVWTVVVLMGLSPAVVAADIFVFALDTSGSMQKQGKFDAARRELAQQIREAQPGDVLYVIAFDSNDYPMGRLEVGEDGSPEAKAQLIAKIQGLKARGRYTNLDQPLKSAKALLLEERAPGARKIVILSDGLSDPSPDHTKVDLQSMAQMIPQTLGWAVYLIGLSDDIAGLFQTSPSETGLVLAPAEPHIKGIPLEHFSRARIAAAMTVTKHDALPPVPPPPPAVPAPPAAPETPPAIPAAPERSAVPQEPLEAAAVLQGVAVPLVWGGAALLCAAFGGWLLLRRRAGDMPRAPRAAFTLEVQEDGGEGTKWPLILGEGEQKSIGPQGDISLGSDLALPKVVCTLRWSTGRLWLTPLDTITVNSRPVATRTPVGPGDWLRVRDRVRMIIEAGEEMA